MKRYIGYEKTVFDKKTGLMWFKDASPTTMPLTFNEALEYIKDINNKKLYGYNDWKLPNRREFLSIINLKTINPSIDLNNPFNNIFNGYYWTATTCARTPDQAWIIHLGGARVRGGIKNFSYMTWPVRNTGKYNLCFFNTGQDNCYNDFGNLIDCKESGQDGEFYKDLKSSDISNRFIEDENILKDLFTGLDWFKNGDFFNKKLNYYEALEYVQRLNNDNKYADCEWRIPRIEEFESISDMGNHSPAILKRESFFNIRDYYWSSSISEYNKDYSWVFYTKDAYIGVGYRQNRDFYLIPVSGKIFDRSFLY